MPIEVESASSGSGGGSFTSLTGAYSDNTSLNNKIVAMDSTASTLASSVNSAYSALVDAATTAIDFTSKRNASFTWTSSRTAVTFTISNDLLAAEAFIEFTKTTASNLVLTFPASTKIVDQNGAEVVGVAVTLTSTASGVFAISIKKASTGYWAVIKRFVA